MPFPAAFDASARRADLMAALEARQEAQREVLAKKLKAEAREAMKAENERYRAELEKLKEMRRDERGRKDWAHRDESRPAAKAIRQQ